MSLLPSLVSPVDAAFLLPETRDQPMHVGSLQLFVPPAGTGPDPSGSQWPGVPGDTSRCGGSHRPRVGGVPGTYCQTQMTTPLYPTSRTHWYEPGVPGLAGIQVLPL